MNRLITSTAIPTRELKIEALASMSASFERFCLASGIEALAEMMEADARDACGPLGASCITSIVERPWTIKARNADARLCHCKTYCLEEGLSRRQRRGTGSCSLHV
jgi:hypothetical protein